MFIETLEFTIPVDLCSLCSTLQKGSQSDLEFPASVNSYGTTQDASIQVALRANKLTFKVDGVSSNASIISKSECRTLKLSVFDVDRSLIPQESVTFSTNVPNFHLSTPVSNPQKRSYASSPTPVRAKIRRNSNEHKLTKPPNVERVKDSHSNDRLAIDSSSSNNVTVKTEPEDPDLIEIDPDPQVLKKEDPEQNSSCMYQQRSNSNTYERNVPHVQDYAEPSTSQHRNPDQHLDDFLVFQDENYENEDNEEYSNDGYEERAASEGFYNQDFDLQNISQSLDDLQAQPFFTSSSAPHRKGLFECPHCGKTFTRSQNMQIHIESVHGNMTYSCVCGKVYRHPRALQRHRKMCSISQSNVLESGILQ